MDEWFEVLVSNVVGATYDEDWSYPWGDIINDDLPRITVSDTIVVEGSGVDTGAVFTVSLSGPIDQEIWASIETRDGTAKDGEDYLGGWALLEFWPGETDWDVEVQVVGDSVAEPSEHFQLAVSMAATRGSYEYLDILDAYGVATIIDDDPSADTTPPDVSAPAVDFARGRSLSGTSKPVPLDVYFTASDPSGISATRLQHRTGTGPYANVQLASASTGTALQPAGSGAVSDSPRATLTARKLEPDSAAPATAEARPIIAEPRPAATPAGTGTRATVKVGTKAKTVHRFRSQATDGVGNTSPFAEAPATRVKVFQDGSRAVKRKGPWTTSRSRAYFGSTVKRTTRKGARVQLTARGTDFAIVATMGRDKGKARVIVDGRAVATIDLYAPRAKPRTIVHAVSFARPGRHTVALQALGTKNAKAKGKRVELDAFLVLTP